MDTRQKRRRYRTARATIRQNGQNTAFFYFSNIFSLGSFQDQLLWNLMNASQRRKFLDSNLAQATRMRSRRFSSRHLITIYEYCAQSTTTYVSDFFKGGLSVDLNRRSRQHLFFDTHQPKHMYLNLLSLTSKHWQC